MNILENIGAQGEIRIYRIDAIPADAKPVAKESGHYIIGHSETGHHHVLEAERVEVFERTEEGMRVLYAILETPGDLRHLRGHYTHRPHDLAPSAYMFRPDREFDHYAELSRQSMD